MDESELGKAITGLLDALGIPNRFDPLYKPSLQQEHLEKFLEILPLLTAADSPFKDILSDSTAYLRLSILCLLAEKPEAALRFAQKAARISAHAMDARTVQAVVALKQADYKRAVGLFDEILSKEVSNWQAWFLKGEALRLRGLLERAVEAYEKAISLRKDRPDIWTSLGSTFADLGMAAKSAMAFAEAATLGDGGAKARKVEVMLSEARQKRQARLYQRVLELAPDNIEALLMLGALSRESGDYASAIAIYSRALEIDPANETAKKGRIEALKFRRKKNECPSCHGSGICRSCEGDGNCGECGGTGNCPQCEGEGDCVGCEGTGDCPSCRGKGKAGFFRSCPDCNGTGKCSTCAGKGGCKKCKGAGKCKKCKGGGKCTECMGSGQCRDCEGRGWREQSPKGM